MKFLTEEVKETIRLTSHQKAILATIAQAGGSVADDVIAADSNLSGALKQLIKMQMVLNGERDTYSMTDLGRKFAKDSNVIDDAGELTADGTSMVVGSGEPTNESVGSFKDYLRLI